MTATVITDPTPVSAPDTGPRRRSWLRADLTLAFAVAAGWQLALTLLGALSERSLSEYQVGPWFPPRPLNLLTHTYRWDAAWYESILHGAYHASSPAPAFYPLFPALVWLVERISFGAMDFLVAGFVVNTLATWLAVAALVKIARFFVRGRTAPWLVVAALLTSAGAVFLHELYSEATFLCFGLVA